MTINFGKNIETQKMAVNGWNWGKVTFGGRYQNVIFIGNDSVFVLCSW
jgi:hypothetical protein